MTTRLLGMLDDLDYPDLSFLMKLAATADRQTSPWREPKNREGYHATQLVKVGLFVRQPLTPNMPEGDLAHVSDIGMLMVKLIRDPKTAEL